MIITKTKSLPCKPLKGAKAEFIIVADIADEMEEVTTETPAQEAEENEVEVNEVTACPPSLAQLYTMFRPIQ